MTTAEQEEAIKAHAAKGGNKIISPSKKPPAPHKINYMITKDLRTILAYTKHPTKDAQGFSSKAYAK